MSADRGLMIFAQALQVGQASEASLLSTSAPIAAALSRRGFQLLTIGVVPHLPVDIVGKDD